MITGLGIGEAVVTVMNERGAPTPVAWTRLRAPESLMGPADPAAMTAAVDGLVADAEVRRGVDRESAREMLAARLEAGAAAAREQEAASQKGGATKGEPADGHLSYPRGSRSTTRRKPASDGGMVGDIMKSPMARDLVRTAAREIVRGVFGVGRRRR